MNRLEIKKKLNEGLPAGFIDKIKNSLWLKGISVSRGRISEVCNPGSDYWNNDVIETGLELIEAEREREENLSIRIKSL